MRLQDLSQTNSLTHRERVQEAVFRARRTMRGGRLYAAGENMQDCGRRERWPLLYESIAEEFAALCARYYR